MQSFGQIKKNFQEYWLLYLIVVQPLLDILAYWQNNSVGTAAGWIRMFILFVLPFYILATTRKRRPFLIAMGIILLFCALHVLNCFRVGYISIFQDVTYLLRIVQMPVLAICFLHYIRDERTKGLVVKGFLINGLIIVVSMVVAFLTHTGDFTYQAYGVGFTGWFSNTNSQSIIIISLVPLAMYYAVRSSKKLCRIAVPIVIFAILMLNGTKACYYTAYLVFAGLSIFLIAEYLLKRKNGARLDILAVCLFGVLLVLVKVVYPYTPRAKMDSSYSLSVTQDQKDIDQEMGNVASNPGGTKKPASEATLEARYDHLSEKTKKFYQERLDKALVSRFGLRQVLLKYGVTPSAQTLSDVRFKKTVYAKCVWENSDNLTKIVGFEYTNMNLGECFDLENDWPAIFYYCGYLGFALYVLFILSFVFLLARHLIRNFRDAFTLGRFCVGITFVLQIALAQYSGAILRRPNVSIYMSLIIALIYYYTVVCPAEKEKDLPA